MLGRIMNWIRKIKMLLHIPLNQPFHCKTQIQACDPHSKASLAYWITSASSLVKRRTLWMPSTPYMAHLYFLESNKGHTAPATQHYKLWLQKLKFNLLSNFFTLNLGAKSLWDGAIVHEITSHTKASPQKWPDEWEVRLKLWQITRAGMHWLIWKERNARVFMAKALGPHCS